MEWMSCFEVDFTNAIHIRTNPNFMPSIAVLIKDIIWNYSGAIKNC